MASTKIWGQLADLIDNILISIWCKVDQITNDFYLDDKILLIKVLLNFYRSKIKINKMQSKF